MRERPDIDILRHALGLCAGGGRNHFVTGTGGRDHAICLNLVARGLMTRHAPSALTGGDDLFIATAAGRQYVADHLAKQPPAKRLTRDQRRYLSWLDADCGCSFGDWVRHRRYTGAQA